VPGWPSTAGELVALQEELAAARPDPWAWRDGVPVGGCFVCFARGGSGPGHAGDPAWAAAALGTDVVVVPGAAGAPYEAGLLALREGPLLEAAVRALPRKPGVLLVNATGRDHPRRAGLALHLGAVLDLPTVGVTHRTLIAAGPWPADERGASSPLTASGEVAGYWVRTKQGTRPLAVHAGWRTGPDTAVRIVLAATAETRTPAPLRRAREAAREARSAAGSRS
jgi:deoxyribonuclease V